MITEITSAKILALSTALSLVSIYFTIKVLRSFDIVDHPGERRSHKKVTPRGAGISFCLLFAAFLFFLEYYVAGEITYSYDLLPIFLGLSIFTFIDDVRHMPILIRLVIHFICVYLFAVKYVWPDLLFQGAIWQWLDNLLVLICLTTYINIYNFMDGIDGLSGSESVCISIGILIHCYMMPEATPHMFLQQVVSLTTIGWSLAFLCFNWHPARVFMGDVGSISIGFLLGGCMLLISLEGINHLIFCIIISYYYLADGGLTILIRFSRGEKIWQPHLQHFFQQAIKNGTTHAQATKSIIMCNLLLWLLAICSVGYPIASFLGASAVVMLTMWRMTA